MFDMEMAGAKRRAENRRAEIWMTAMLPHLKEPPDLHEFVYGEKDRRAEMVRCLSEWDAVDRALAASRRSTDVAGVSA